MPLVKTVLFKITTYIYLYSRGQYMGGELFELQGDRTFLNVRLKNV